MSSVALLILIVALAGVALEAALRADPRYRLAVLLDQLVTHGIRLPAA